jgi:hypothetical protein
MPLSNYPEIERLPMKVICPGPGCQKVFDVDPDDEAGCRLTCPDCGAVLAVERDRLRILETAPTLPNGGQPKESPPMSRYDEPESTRPTAPGAWSTVVLVIGAVLVVLSWFIGLAAGYWVEQARAEFSVDDQAVRREGEMLASKRRKLDNERLGPQDKAGAGQKDADRRLKELEKKHKERELEWAETKLSRQEDLDRWQARYWQIQFCVNLGILAGLFFLIAAALGYQMPHQPLPRKIVGAVLLCGIVLYTLSAYLGGVNLLFRSVFR